MTAVDGLALAGFCQSAIRWKQSELEITKYGLIRELKDKDGNVIGYQKNQATTTAKTYLDLMHKYGADLGLNPSARGKLQVALKDGDPLEEGILKYISK